MRKVRLKSIQTNSGFLEHCKVDFSPSLTCIIGARGTCKSTLVESVRFAFQSGSERIKELVSEGGMLRKTLGAGSVRCVVSVEDDGQITEYTIDREIDGAPRVLRNGSRDPLGDEVLHEIEIYSQGALQQIASADKPQLRLELIDRIHRQEILSLRSEIKKRVADLKNIGARLRVLRGDLERKRLDIRDIDQLRAELGQVTESRPELPPTLEEQHALYVQRQKALGVLEDLLTLQRQLMSELGSVVDGRAKLETLRTNLDELQGVELPDVNALIRQIENVIAAVAQGRDTLASIPIAAQKQQLTSEFEKGNEAYYELRQQQHAVSEALKREDAVRRRLMDLEKIEKEVKQLDTEREALAQRRRASRAEVAQMRDAIFEMRVNEAQRINEEFGDVVLLAVRRAAHSRPFVSRLSELRELSASLRTAVSWTGRQGYFSEK